jgi:SPP1 family predicted phage head-tail adaptor
LRGYRTFNPSPHPGDLQQRITIGKTISETNENGYRDDTDKVICRVWAGVDDAGNQKYRAADSEVVEDVLNFVIRYRRDIEAGMWVEFDGERRIITNVGHYGYRKQYLGLKTYRQEVVSR